jgi:O-antigen ligase
MILWAEHDGGYDQDTWYWGTLLLLAVLTVCVVGGFPALRLARLPRAAIALFALYVLWSYASIAWAQAPGTSFDGSNRALLYLIVFSIFAIIPWTAARALVILTTWAVGIDLIALVTAFRLASGDQLNGLFLEGRLIAPTGYFNSSAALFTMAALIGTSLSIRRELPAPIRGLLIAGACVDMQLALMGQSRGWLLTLPLVLLIAVVLMRGRIRFVLAALLPLMATVIPVHVLLDVHNGADTSSFDQAAKHAGQLGLVTFAATLALGTGVASGERLLPTPDISARAMRVAGVLLAALTIAGAGAGVAAATHGQPVQFVTRQLNGFANDDTAGTSSHFATVGSGRYDFWRVALEAFLENPVGGLGQDNFENYYVMHRRTDEEPAWPHSLEMRLLACTGIVGFALFAGFLGVALRGSIRLAPGPSVSAVAMLPLIDWLLHGSVDWFWEMPALSAPALGFLGMAMVMGQRPPAGSRPIATPTPGASTSVLAGRRAGGHGTGSGARSAIALTIGAVALVAATAALGFSYLSVRHVSDATNVEASDPGAALNGLRSAAALNPLSATPDELGGQIALVNGLIDQAQQFYQQAIDRDPDAWMNWFGMGLATSALDETKLATAALRRALSIDRRQPAIRTALALVNTTHPLTPSRALSLIVAPH